MKKGTLIAIVFVAAVIAILAFTTLGTRKFRCEVCVTYRGRTQCRAAAASTRETAQRAAVELACAGMEERMTDRINCPATPPDSIKWLP